MKYQPTIGLEIHIELSTTTKMFCACKNDPFKSEPNNNVCPICLGMPGSLPFPNKRALEMTAMLGKALGAKIAEITKFDRKHYFYPDLPKGFQISQYDQPLCTGGELLGIAIRRVHIEEDTGKLLHDQHGHSLVDFNRAGVPLVELVTEPVIRSAEQAAAFAKELQLLVRYLGISEADMEKGQMRVEVNISAIVRVVGPARKVGAQIKLDPRSKLTAEILESGSRVEVKNLNSFRSVERAIKYETLRQSKLLEAGEVVVQETRGWDEAKQVTVSQRFKETESDYRYFPEPDIPPLEISKLKLQISKLPELPEERRERYQKLGVGRGEIGVLVGDLERARRFDGVVKVEPALAQALSQLFVHEPELLKKTDAELLKLAKLPAHQRKAAAAGHEVGESLSETELEAIIGRVVKENPKAASDYRSGKTAALQALIGAVMRETKGRVEPEAVRQMLELVLS